MCCLLVATHHNVRECKWWDLFRCVQGVKFLDITVLLSPVISSWLSAVGIKLESYAASAIAADSQGGNRSWAPVARLSGVMCSSSVLDLFYVIINGVDKVAARTIVKRPPVAAVAAAEALAAAAGGAIRYSTTSILFCCNVSYSIVKCCLVG